MGHCCPFGSGFEGLTGSGVGGGKYRGPLTPQPERVIDRITQNERRKLQCLIWITFIVDQIIKPHAQNTEELNT